MQRSADRIIIENWFSADRAVEKAVRRLTRRLTRDTEMSMASKRKFYRQTFSIEVLSEDSPLPEDISLEGLAYEITEGDRSGSVKMSAEDEVDGPTMARLLMKQGSDPGFFGLTETGEDEE